MAQGYCLYARLLLTVSVPNSSSYKCSSNLEHTVCAGVMFSTLCNGGTLVLADPSTFEVAARTCHILPLTPSILVTLDPGAGFDTVEAIFLGGESPSPSLIEAWSSPRR